MNTVCLTTNLSSAELAAWVQAIGSVLAIIAAFLIAFFQSRLQHRSALVLHRKEQRHARMAMAKTLSALATNCAKAIAHSSAKLRDREAVHKIAEGEVYFDLGELRRIDTAMASIPLYSLPDTLVSPTMIISATLRQFIDKVEMALRVHRQMDSAAFEDLFRVFGEMNDSLRATCEDVEAEVKRIQGET
jgi:hypothetical protein